MIPLYENEQALLIKNLRKNILHKLGKVGTQKSDEELYQAEAELYWLAANSLSKIASDNPENILYNQFHFPAIFLLTYTCEIGLKALIKIGGNKNTIYEHKLTDLFNLITPAHQHGLYNEFCITFKTFLINIETKRTDLTDTMLSARIMQINSEINALDFIEFKNKFDELIGKTALFVTIRYPSNNNPESIYYSMLLNVLGSATKNYVAKLIR